MLELEKTVMLSLKPRVRQPEVAAEAWLLTGPEPASWVHSLIRASVDLNLCQGYVLPMSLQDRTPSGFLVVVGLTEADWSLAHAYRCLGKRLWIPCDAELSPPLHGVELDGFLHHSIAVFHPGIGMIGFDETDLITVAELIGNLREREINFSWAHPGLPLQDRLYGITAAAVQRVGLLLDDVGNEIGFQEPSTLPKAPDESKESGVRHWRKQMKLRMLKALNRLSSNTNEKEQRGGWKERLEVWTEDRLEALRKDQERELNRLLQLLKSDPDEGLKFAMPLSGGQSGSDGPKDAELAERSTDFGLGKLGREQSGSPWVLDWQKHYELSRQYREAANRELRLGRHRRAAYIYAELLKDFREAANVLRQGKHFREASVLYLKHLGDPLEGARCLREGGFLLEAIPIFERKKQHETAAELYAELGNEVEAERQYRLAVSRAIAHGNTVNAATLLEQRLNQREEAVALLQKSWPRSKDAVMCLAHELNLYQRQGVEDDLVKRLGEVTADHPPGQAVGLMETILRVARQSPSSRTREAAELSCFTVAGRWLGSPTFSESKSMLALVRRLVPEDRLLVRDTARFQQQSEDAAKARAERLAKTTVDSPVVLLDSQPMPSWVSWQRLEARARSGFYALGIAARGIAVMRMRWDGSFQTQMLPNAMPNRSGPPLELAPTEGALPEVLSILGMKQLPPTVLRAADAFSSEVRVENPPWVNDSLFLGLAYGGNGVAWTLQRDKEEGLVVVSSYSAMGDLIATHTIRLPVGALSEDVRAPLPMICAREQLVFGFGQHLIRYYRDRVDSLEMSRTLNRLHFAPHGRLQLAASYDVGAEIFWGDGNWGRSCLLDLPVNDPFVTFTRTGDVLALSRDRLDWLGYQKGTFVPMHYEDLQGFGDPLGIFPTEIPNVYAMVSQREVRMIKVTPWQLGK
ncbi:MAG: hypothetical protein L7V86_09625 [Verrucomicrobiales bacterium]|nr:hypothetical protein [Verrucomicrobiales bacterium]